MKKLLFAVFLSLAILSPYSIAFAEEGVGDKFILELEGRFWMPNLSANIKSSGYSVSGVETLGTDINVKDDLGIKNENFFSGRLILQITKRNKIRFSYLPIRYTGEKQISQSISFEGATFTAGTIKTELKADMYDLTYELDAIKGDIGFLGIIIGVKYFDLYGSIEGTTVLGTVKEEGKGQAPILVIGLAGRIYPMKYFNLSGEITGLSVGRASIYDAEAAINVNPIKYAGISGGYRIMRFSAEDNGGKESVTAMLYGPFVALMVRF